MKAPLKEAIALEYGKRKTPVISAKGEDELAQRIIDEAQRHGVYVAEDPQLLALLSRIDLDKEIPPELYTAVAVILSWVYWLKGMRPGDEKSPKIAPPGAPQLGTFGRKPRVNTRHPNAIWCAQYGYQQ
jgi:flagellar biosynthesis protein